MRLFSPIGLALMACCLAASASAQTDTTARQVSLAVRSSSQMEQADADVVVAHRAAIARAAAFYDFTLDGSWSYEEAMCPLAPQDIILNYSSRQTHGVSSFSAVVPRQGSVIRIVPLAHDGTAPSVVPWSAHSYNVFNAITAGRGGVRQVSSGGSPGMARDDRPGDKFVWGLCYVALVNERAVVPHPDSELHVFSATEPTFRLGNEGGSELSFTVRDDSRYYSVWELEFSPNGALVRADRDQHMRPIDDLEAAKAVVPEPGSGGSAPSATDVTEAAEPSPAYAAPAHHREPASTQADSAAVIAHAPTPVPVASMPADAPPARKTKPEEPEVHPVPEAAPLIEHPIPDGVPLVTRPIPQS